MDRVRNVVRRAERVGSKTSLSTLLTPFMKKSMQKLPKGSTLFKEAKMADKVYFVIDGEVKLHNSHRTLEVIPSGKFIGLETVFPFGYYMASATAETDVKICTIDKEDFLEIFDECPSYSLAVMDEVFRSIEMGSDEPSETTREPHVDQTFFLPIFNF